MSRTVTRTFKVQLSVADNKDVLSVADELMDLLCNQDTDVYESCDGVDPIDFDWSTVRELANE